MRISKLRMSSMRGSVADYMIGWGQIRENVLKNEYAKHVGYKQFVTFHLN